MICRDAGFWDQIAGHPEVAPHICLGLDLVSLGPLVENKNVLPLRSENGGLIFVPLDHYGQIAELHTLYRPEGWGREVAKAAPGFMAQAFETAEMIVTQEQEGHWRSRPPRSHGWRVQGEFKDFGYSRRLRLWVLTGDAWIASPVGRRSCL